MTTLQFRLSLKKPMHIFRLKSKRKNRFKSARSKRKRRRNKNRKTWTKKAQLMNKMEMKTKMKLKITIKMMISSIRYSMTRRTSRKPTRSRERTFSRTFKMKNEFYSRNTMDSQGWKIKTSTRLKITFLMLKIQIRTRRSRQVRKESEWPSLASIPTKT